MTDNQLTAIFFCHICTTFAQQKRPDERFTPEEICKLVCDKLSTTDIEEIEPKILAKEGKAPECPSVKVGVGTSETLRKAFSAILSNLN